MRGTFHHGVGVGDDGSEAWSLATWRTTTILLERLRDFDDAAWEEFVERFRDPVVRFGMRLGLGEGEVDDFAQDTLIAFAKAYREGRYQRDRGRLSSWLFGIAHKEAQRMKRECAKRPGLVPGRADGSTTFFSSQPDEDELRKTWDDGWDHHVIARCLEQARSEFEPSTFEAFELAALRQVPAEEVARRLGLTRNAVYVAKHRVLARLGELQEGFATTG